MSDHIPPELLSAILAKLSIEDIVRCTGVCKSWYSLITSSPFISLHTQIAMDKKGLLLVRNYKTAKYCQIKAERFSIHFDDDTLSEYKRLNFSFEPWTPNFKVIDCVNGVLCLTHKLNTQNDDIILWNPSIRKYLRLPQPLQPFDSDDDSVGTQLHSIGFGFNSATNDFKVVRVLDNWGIKSPYHAQVYEPKLGLWRSINPKGLCGAISRFSNQAFLNGAVHWIGTNSNEEDVNMIVSFDVCNEVFAEWNVPDCISDRDMAFHLRVSAMGESLSLVYHRMNGGGEMCRVWVMKQYGVADSWTKLYNIRPGPGLLPWQIFGFRRNENVLLTCSRGGALYCYDPEEGCLKKLKSFRRKKFDAVNFMESLALIGVRGEHGMEIEAEDKAVSKRSSDDHVEKKMKMQSQCALIIC